MKNIIKPFLKRIPIAFTKNQRYDAQTIKVLRKVCNTDSNCVDVGCHKGEMLDKILQFSPNGKHFCFEPIPDLYTHLIEKHYPPNCYFYQTALSYEKGTTSFNYVTSNPSYSGILRRRYDRPNEEDTLITVETDLLDNIIPYNLKIDFIKIDVEGAEILVLKGAEQTIKKWRPIVVFEHGLGGSDVYGTTPTQIYEFFKQCDMHISLMSLWLSGKPPLSIEEFETQFYQAKNYYFIAY
jgi:FkbM family methyltransferase